MLRLSPLLLVLAMGASRLDGVSLRWKPTDSMGKAITEASRAFRTKKVQVLPFTDTRADRPLIGRNTEEPTPKDVTTADDVGAWCSTRLTELLKLGGVPVVTEGADLVVSGQVLSFMVDEDDRYRGLVSLRLEVKDAAGKELWAGVVAGDANRFGRSYKADNYMETLSDAFLHAASAFFTEPALASRPE